MLPCAVMTTTGLNGAYYQMIGHGITSAMMFFLVGVVYERAHHRKIDGFEGRSTLRTWMSSIAVRVASDYRNRAHRRREPQGTCHHRCGTIALLPPFVIADERDRATENRALY